MKALEKEQKQSQGKASLSLGTAYAFRCDRERVGQMGHEASFRREPLHRDAGLAVPLQVAEGVEQGRQRASPLRYEKRLVRKQKLPLAWLQAQPRLMGIDSGLVTTVPDQSRTIEIRDAGLPEAAEASRIHAPIEAGNVVPPGAIAFVIGLSRQPALDIVDQDDVCFAGFLLHRLHSSRLPGSGDERRAGLVDPRRADMEGVQLHALVDVDPQLEEQADRPGSVELDPRRADVAVGPSQVPAPERPEIQSVGRIGLAHGDLEDAGPRPRSIAPGQVAQLRCETPFTLKAEVRTVHQVPGSANRDPAPMLGSARNCARQLVAKEHVPIEKRPAHLLGRRPIIKEFAKRKPIGPRLGRREPEQQIGHGLLVTPIPFGTAKTHQKILPLKEDTGRIDNVITALVETVKECREFHVQIIMVLHPPEKWLMAIELGSRASEADDFIPSANSIASTPEHGVTLIEGIEIEAQIAFFNNPCQP